MSANDSSRTFKCPSCGAPVQIEAGQKTTTCPYCNETVVIPEALRIPARSTFTPKPEQYTPVVPARVTPNANRPSFTGRIFTALVMVIILGLVAYFAFGFNPFGKFMFANQVMSFGSKGIGQGMFQNPRCIGVDGNGNIVVADYMDGRIQVFSPNGKFLSMFTVMNAAGKPANAFHIAISRDGKIYVANLDLQVYDETGKVIGKIPGDMAHVQWCCGDQPGWEGVRAHIQRR